MLGLAMAINMLIQPVVVVGEGEEWSGAMAVQVSVTKTHNGYEKKLKTDCKDISKVKQKMYAQPLFQPFKWGTIFKSVNQIQNFSNGQKRKKILGPTFSHHSH